MTHVNVSKRRQIHLDLCTAGHPSCIFAPQSSSPLKNHWNISKAGTRRSCGRVSLYYSPRGWNFEEERRNKKRGLLLPTCSSPPRNMSESGSFTALLFFFSISQDGRWFMPLYSSECELAKDGEWGAPEQSFGSLSRGWITGCWTASRVASC